MLIILKVRAYDWRNFILYFVETSGRFLGDKDCGALNFEVLLPQAKAVG
jgi:hypothetical protein